MDTQARILHTHKHVRERIYRRISTCKEKELLDKRGLKEREGECLYRLSPVVVFPFIDDKATAKTYGHAQSEELRERRGEGAREKEGSRERDREGEREREREGE